MRDMKSVGVGDPFKLVTNLEIVVPPDYDHKTCFTRFRAEHIGESHFYSDPKINDGNYAGVTTRCQPGWKFVVKVFSITEGVLVSFEQCLTKVYQEGGVLVGAQGLSLVCKHKKKLENASYISPDQETSLWRDDKGFLRVPSALVSLRGFYFLSDPSCRWGNGDRLLCFVLQP